MKRRLATILATAAVAAVAVVGVPQAAQAQVQNLPLQYSTTSASEIGGSLVINSVYDISTNWRLTDKRADGRNSNATVRIYGANGSLLKYTSQTCYNAVNNPCYFTLNYGGFTRVSYVQVTVCDGGINCTTRNRYLAS